MPQLNVMLARNWFGPDGQRYRQSPVGTVIPAEFRDLLPSDAEIFAEIADPFEVPRPRRSRKKEEPRNAPPKTPKSKVSAQAKAAGLKSDTLSGLAKTSPQDPLGFTSED